MDSSRDVIETWFRRVWSEEDAKAIDELFVPDGAARGLGANVLIGPAAFKQFHAAMCGLLRHMEIGIDHLLESRDWSATQCTLRAQARQSGAPVTMTGSVLFRIEEGKILEAYNHWDFLGLFVQLGTLPADTFEKALRHERIT